MGPLILLAVATVLALYAAYEFRSALVGSGGNRVFQPHNLVRAFSSHRALVALGVVTELVYLLGLVTPYSLPRWLSGSYLDLGAMTNHARPGFILFIGSFSIVFVLFGVAWQCVWNHADRYTLPLVLGFGALFGLTMTFMYPITALDIFAYFDENLILTQYHQNPMFIAPSAFPQDPLMSLSASFNGAVAPYGPLAIVIDAVPTFLTGRHTLASLLLLKLMFACFLMLEAYLAYRILRRVAPRYAITGALFVAWNPLLLYEAVGNGHNDIVMTLFVLFAIWALAERKFVPALVLLVASVLVKYTTGLLAPLFVLYGLTHCASSRERIRFVVLGVIASLALVVAAYAPFWEGTRTITNVLSQSERYADSWSSALGSLFPTGPTAPQNALLGRVLFVPIYLYALWLSIHRFPDLLRGLFLVMFFFLALAATNTEPWYSIWPIVLAASVPGLVERLAVALLGYGAAFGNTLYIFIWVWLGLGDPNNFRIINVSVYSVTFVPAALTLLIYIAWLGVGNGRRVWPRGYRDRKVVELKP
jgi:hypothetical protein